MLDVRECVGECMGGTGSVGFDDPPGLNDIVPQVLDILLCGWVYPLMNLCTLAHGQDRHAYISASIA
jgi:hypothetical protein